MGGRVARTGEAEGTTWRGLLRAVWAMASLLMVAVLALGEGACDDRLAEARRLEAEGSWEAAVSIYQQVLADDPDDLAALSGAAVGLMVLQRFDEALALQERVVAADPADVQSRLELGFNYLNHQGRPDDAVRVLQEAAELEPTAKNLTFLAQALEERGNAAEAEEVLRRAIAIDPTYGYAHSQLEQLLEGEGRALEAQVLREEAASTGLTAE
jgi:tetratricopeptide (TPR) repeat protein